MDQEATVKRICASLERDVGINLHTGQVRVEPAGRAILLEGMVARISEKRRAALVAQRIAGDIPVEDRLAVQPAQDREDGTIRDVLSNAILSEPVFLHFNVSMWEKEAVQDLRLAPRAVEGSLVLAVNDGVVTLGGEVWSLSHKRFAGLLAWWVPGVKNVDNQIAVKPADSDTDDEINDDVNLALEKDPLVHEEQISSITRDHVVTLQGLVPTEEEKRMAEDDIWYMGLGVRGVINEVMVQPDTEGGQLTH